MKIYIQEKDKNPIQFSIPNQLIFNHFIASIAISTLKEKSNLDLSSKELLDLFKVLKESKKIFGPYYLVEVESNDGEIVKIQL